MLKLIFYYILILKIIGVSILIPLYSSPSAVILTLIFLVVLVALFLFNFGIVFLSVLFLIVYVGAVLILYVYALSVLRERLQGFSFKKLLYLYILPFYLLFILLFQILIVNSFETLSFFSLDFSKIGLNSGIISYDFIFYNFLFNKYNELQNIGVILFTTYLPLFVCCGVLLLITLIGSISVLTESYKNK